MADAPALLARGPWALDQIEATWSDDAYAAPEQLVQQADDAIQQLKDRGSPAHDGVGARLAKFEANPDTGTLRLDLQPIRWALRLVQHDASASVSALCVIRSHEGEWLAGRRAQWLASWPGRWALGAGGAVDPQENPADTLLRETQEEWAVTPQRVQAEALVRLPTGMIMFVGQAWLAEGAQVTRDEEHDAHAWWPENPDDWPHEADEPLRRVAHLLR
jgi:8-oxo-dGTP diphosphatase